MTSPSKAKGDKAEREVQELLRELLDMPHIRRALGAGRKDDVGDIDNVPNTVIQVANYTNIATALNLKLPAVEQQRLNARKRFAAMFLRRRGGKYVVVMTPEQWAKLWKAAHRRVKSPSAG